MLSLLTLVLIARSFAADRDWRRLIRPAVLLLPLVAFAGYALLSTIWAADPGAAFEKGAVLLVVVLAVFAATAAISALDRQEVSRNARALAGGAFIGALAVGCELVSGGVLTRTAWSILAQMFPDNESFREQAASFRVADLRQGVAVLTLQLWPALLAIVSVAARPANRLLSALFIAAVAVAVFSSARMTSQVALVVSLLVFPIAWRWPRITAQAFAALWCFAFVLVIPMAFLAYDAQLHKESLLPRNAQARVIIWQYTAERTLERPWLGIGADSTTLVDEQRGRAEKPEGFVYERRTGRHPHNLFLQVWYELGAIGAILAAFTGASAALAIMRLPNEAQPFAVATFVAFFTTVSFAWSMWQTWLMCSVALLPLYIMLASRATAGAPSVCRGPRLINRAT